MRTFALGSGADRKVVSIDVEGCSVWVIERRPDGGSKKSERRLASESQAGRAGEKMASELINRGFREQAAASASRGAPAAKRNGAPGIGAVDLQNVFDEDDGGESVAPALPRVAPAAAAPSADGTPKKKKKKSGKKKRAQAENGDGLDRKVVLGAAAFGMLLIAIVGFVVYDTFLKPASIVGTWKGSRLEYEISVAMSFNQYMLVLDENKNASLMMGGGDPATGTYSVKGDLLTISLKGSDAPAPRAKAAAPKEAGDDEEGEGGGDDGGGDADFGPSELKYKIVLGHTTLDLFDPSSGKKVVQLVRMSETPKVGKGSSKTREAPKDLAAGAVAKVDKDADAKIAATEYVAKDGEFKLRHPSGWEPTTGGRADNSFSWIKLNKGSAQIKVTADVQGSLMSGSDIAQGNLPEGSPMAPVHNAHVLAAKAIADEYSDYSETEPTLFKGSRLGEGRVSAFTASAGGLFGGKLKGYRITLLTNNRRITIMCQCPAGEFDGLKATFMAVARSVSY